MSVAANVQSLFALVTTYQLPAATPGKLFRFSPSAEKLARLAPHLPPHTAPNQSLKRTSTTTTSTIAFYTFLPTLPHVRFLV